MMIVMATYTFKVLVLGIVMFAAARRHVGLRLRDRAVRHRLRRRVALLRDARLQATADLRVRPRRRGLAGREARPGAA